MNDPEKTYIRNNKGTDKLFALVTGGSRGLGREFVIELARKKINVLIVALPDDGLPGLCQFIRNNFSVECHYLEIDLTNHNSIEELVNWASGYRINMLINNAGMGGSREFVLAETEYLDSMIALNVRALTLITHKFLPELKSHKKSYILNVASMASFSPIGYKTIYPASKVFVLYFTRGLSQELKGTGVVVSVVHPGPMKTNRHVTKTIEKLGMFGKIGLLTPEYVASKSLNLLLKGRSLIILGWLNHLAWLVMKTVPLSIRLPLITNIIKKDVSGSKKQPI